MSAARKGCKLANSDARDGPTRSIAVNQRTFVTTSGPSTAKTNPTHTSQPKSSSWPASCGAPARNSGTETARSSTALSRKGEYRCMSGAIATEYAAQVAAPSTASASPFTSAERPRSDPIATSATPQNESVAAAQNRQPSRSIPVALERRTVKIGSVPNRSATVVAVVKRSA